MLLCLSLGSVPVYTLPGILKVFLDFLLFQVELPFLSHFQVSLLQFVMFVIFVVVYCLREAGVGSLVFSGAEFCVQSRPLLLLLTDRDRGQVSIRTVDQRCQLSPVRRLVREVWHLQESTMDNKKCCDS